MTIIDTTPRLIELELTHACQLACAHCLTSSHPGAGHGSMTLPDWLRAVEQAAEAGTETVQLIGGEPTASPYWVPVLEHALGLGMGVQVYSNLYAVTEAHWAIYSRPGVTLATSYYSDDPAEHDRVTGKPGSHARTRGNLVEALRRGIRVQVGIVRVFEGQRADEAAAELAALGIPAPAIKIDRARAVGRANPDPAAGTPVSELCGRCGDGRAAILPDGTLAPCVLGRAQAAGNVTTTPLAEILASPTWAEIMERIPRPVRPTGACTPSDSDDCDPARTTACAPAYDVTLPYPTIRLAPRRGER